MCYATFNTQRKMSKVNTTMHFDIHSDEPLRIPSFWDVTTSNGVEVMMVAVRPSARLLGITSYKTETVTAGRT